MLDVGTIDKDGRYGILCVDFLGVGNQLGVMSKNKEAALSALMRLVGSESVAHGSLIVDGANSAYLPEMWI